MDEHGYEHGPDEMENRILEEQLDSFLESYKEDRLLNSEMYEDPTDMLYEDMRDERAIGEMQEPVTEMYEPMTDEEKELVADLMKQSPYSTMWKP